MFPAGRTDVHVRFVRLRSGLSLRVLESGRIEGAPILLLHGWGASGYMWRDWFAPLAAAGHRILAIDLPGHGLSDKPDDDATYSLAGMVSIIQELLDVERLSKVDVVAQSMGGTISVEIAATDSDRIRRLIVVNPACFGVVRIQRLARMVSPPVVDRVLPRLVPRWLIARTHRMVYGDPSRVTRRDEDEYWAPSQFPEFTRAMRRLVHEFTWTRLPAERMAHRLRAMERRMLVVLGPKDNLVRDSAAYVEEMRATGFAPRVETIAGGGHAVNEECPDEVVALALGFFRERPRVKRHKD
jgi:Predicted hydrolases or acyltransferases (alpha/beta hydrolase superfamily)